MDCSLPGSSVHGILQARILEWSAIPFPGDLPNSGIEPALQADSLPAEPPGNSGAMREKYHNAPYGWSLVTAAMKLKDACSSEGKLGPT